MRTDAIIDRRFVHCPNASTLGYGKYRAQVSDWIAWADSDDREYIGRMIGRVKFAPALGETPAIRNWIEVLTLTMEHTHAAIRWINPADVTHVHANVPDISRFLQWFAGPLPDRDWIVGADEHGSLRANQAPDMPDWDFQQSIARFNEYRRRNHRSIA